MAGSIALIAAAAVTACSSNASSSSGGGKYGFSEAKQDPSATITVWTDATRTPVISAFEKAYPGIKVTQVVYDGSTAGSDTFKTKMSLYDRAGSGWPDVVWSSIYSDASWASQPDNGTQAFAAPLSKGLVPNNVLANFAKGTLNPCTVNGTVYCLRNDVDPNVLWYSKSLMDKFGYSVPTTWQQYEALGLKLAKQHPGYIVGSIGDAWAEEIFFWASRCEANNITGPTSVTVNTTSSDCVRAAKMIDALDSAHVLSTESVLTPEFNKTYRGKVLMMPGPSWYASTIFQPSSALDMPAGQLGAAGPLPWGNESPVTGDCGGGTWYISTHSKNVAADEKFIQFAATSDAYQVDLSPNYPAYAPAAKKWLARRQASGYYATNLSSLVSAASEVWPDWGAGQFSQEGIWAKNISSKISEGTKMVSLLPAWGQAIKEQAQVDGYTVKG